MQASEKIKEKRRQNRTKMLAKEINSDMDFKYVLKDFKLEPYVKDIFILENSDITKKSLLPFFADGCPGIMFQQCESDVFLYPKNKKLSEFFLYGQSIQPIKIALNGAYRLIVFQLYPLAAKILLGVNPKELNDDCYDLNLIKHVDMAVIKKRLKGTSDISMQVETIANFISGLIRQSVISPDQKVPLAINLILNSKGKISIKTLRETLRVTERTLQRQFIEYVGISPKQFAKIIQFQSSLNQLSGEVYSKLTDIVYENGYADQSHFIRNFKKYTGKKPSEFRISN